jgi:hypothetical protein
MIEALALLAGTFSGIVRAIKDDWFPGSVMSDDEDANFMKINDRTSQKVFPSSLNIPLIGLLC